MAYENVMGLQEPVESVDEVRSDRRDDVLVIYIDNPPTAALSARVRTGLAAHLDAAAEDDEVRALVIAGADGRFATGAGVSEALEPNTPDLGTICDRIEAFDKPVVVAIEGAALGGGLELALAAHLRVAQPNARLGSPEITLGLIPNAGGTQRLPKVVGGLAALKLLLSGRAVNGEAAKKLGLVDVLAKDVVEAAVANAHRLAGSAGELRRSSTRRDRLGEGTGFLEAVAMHRKAADASPLDAPIRMIECIEAALLLPFDIGRGMEQAVYADLVTSEHSKSLRHVFAAERKLQAATRWEGRVPSRTLASVTVVGANGICAEVVVQCLDAGFHVTVAEVDDAALEQGVGRIIGHFDARVAAGTMTEDAVEQLLDRMNAMSGFHTVAGADVVIDPSPILTKKRVAALDAAMKAGAVLVTGGESVELTTVAAMTSRATDIVGMRFYPGVKKNRLVELTVTEKTSPRTVATARALARKIDRLIVDTAPGKMAVGTRLIEALHAAADLCLEDGARISQIDAALKDWGLPFGSFAWRDMVGIKRPGGPRGLEGQRGGGIDAVLGSVGRVGISIGRGYYIYGERGKPGEVDPEVEEMVNADRAAKQIKLRTLSDGDVRARCVAAMAGAGAEVLEEGMVKSPADIDMVAVHGLGFARRTGGVMFAGDLMGLERVQKLLNEMSRVSGRIKPAPSMIQDLVKSGKTLSDLNG